MRRITIWDMDFYHKRSFVPNPLAMKISSYHKQKGDLINFVEEEHHIKLTYDIYYIIKEKRSTPMPERKLLDDKRVRLIGHDFRFFDNAWSPSMVISAVRPDYLLYPLLKNNKYYNAHMLQYFHGKTLIKNRQPFENTAKHHRKTLVIDKEFWDAALEDIIYALEDLQNYRNIAFEHFINVKVIMENEIVQDLLCKLHFSPGTFFRFKNNYGHSYEDALAIFAFLKRFKAAVGRVRITEMPFKAITTNHWNDKEGALYDLERCFKIIDYAKKHKIHIRVASPPNRFDSPFWYYFENLERWTLYAPATSYIEFMTWGAQRRTKHTWDLIINDPKKWVTTNVQFLLSLWTKTDLVFRFGFREWGDNFLQRDMVDFNSLNNYHYLHKDIKNYEEDYRKLTLQEEY